MATAIEFRHYTKILKKRTILSEVDIAMEQGKIHGLYGHNGSGKSMLLRAIAGLIGPTKGEVSVFGQVVGEDISFPESMGLVIENVGFWPYYTGLENLKMLASIKKKIGEEEVRSAILRVGLDPDDKRTYKKYSLGMKQRLGIAQAIMEQPDLILLDEPTNALDTDGIEQIRQIILEEKERGATVVLASHNREDLKLLCDEFYKIEDGRLRKGEMQE